MGKPAGGTTGEGFGEGERRFDALSLLQALEIQMRLEIGRGTTLWADPEWNRTAKELLVFLRKGSRTEPPSRRQGARPLVGGAASLGHGGVPVPGRQKARQAGDQEVKHLNASSERLKKHYGPPPEAKGRSRDWVRQLKALEEEARRCTRCPLHKTRTNMVFNSGSGKVPLVFVGEAPGADEDAQGEAFVGRAGQLLTRIVASIALDRKDVYICNVLKCRPPGNRNPLPEEIEACAPFLYRQLEILKPRVICTLGLFASQLLLGTSAPIGKLRGRVFEYGGVPLIPTYHPAALLRNPGLKETVARDMDLVRKVLDHGPNAEGVKIEQAPAQARRKRGDTLTGDLFGAG